MKEAILKLSNMLHLLEKIMGGGYSEVTLGGVLIIF